MKKVDLWILTICVAVAVFGGFHEGGGYVDLDGHLVKQPRFNVIGAIMSFILAIAAMVLASLLWEAVKSHVINEHNRAQNVSAPNVREAQPLAPTPAASTTAQINRDAAVFDFRIGDVVRYVHGGRQFTITLVDQTGVHCVSEDYGASYGVTHVAAPQELTLVERRAT